MKTYQANLLNALILILMPLWAYLTYEGTLEKPEQSVTALIPLFLGFTLLLCHKGIKNENKIIAHVAVLLTLIAHIAVVVTLLILIALVGKRLPISIEQGGAGLFRVIAMSLTSFLAMITFVKSFIANRKKS